MVLQQAARAAVGEEVAQMGVAHQFAVERHGGAAGHAHRLAAIDRDDDVLDADIGVVFGGRNGIANGFLGMVHIDDVAGPDALGLAQGSADDTQAARLGAADQAHRLRRTDVEHGDQAAAIGRRFSHAAQFDGLSH